MAESREKRAQALDEWRRFSDLRMRDRRFSAGMILDGEKMAAVQGRFWLQP